MHILDEKKKKKKNDLYFKTHRPRGGMSSYKLYPDKGLPLPPPPPPRATTQ